MSTVTTLMLSVLLVLAALVLLFAPELVAVITPGFDEAQLAETTELTRIMVLSPLFLAAGAVATSVLNSRERFGAAALAPLVYNLAIIFGALVARAGVRGRRAWRSASCSARSATSLVQVPSLVRIGARIRPFVDLRDGQARTALLLMVPRAIGLGATQVVFLVMTSLASTLGAEALAGVQLRVRGAPDPDRGDRGAARGRPAAVAVARGGARRRRGVPRLVVRGLALLAYVMIAIAALGIVVSGDLVRLLFGVANMRRARSRRPRRPSRCSCSASRRTR